MNEMPQKKVAAWTWGLILLPLVALILYTTIGPGSSSNNSSGEFVFDPGPVKELEIKGQPIEYETSWDDLKVSDAPAVDDKVQARGKELYAKACAACHGDDGKGDGTLVNKLNFSSRPANFTTPIASFKLRSTQKGTLPADADIFRSMTRGLPGTAMLSFRSLPEVDRWALVSRVKEFWANGKKWEAPKPLEIPESPLKDEALLKEGHDQFNKWCQNCHGSDGMGGTSFSFQMKPVYPAVIFAREGGKYMLRGSKPENIARTLLGGLGGIDPMMSFKPTFYGDEPNAHDMLDGNRKLWGTAYYVRKLIEAQQAK